MNNRYLQTIKSRINFKVDQAKIRIRQTIEQIKYFVSTYWFRAVMLGIVVWMFLIKDVSINLNLKANPNSFSFVQQTESTVITSPTPIVPQNTSLLNIKENKALKTTFPADAIEDNLMNTYSNLPFDGNSLLLTESEKKKAEKKRKQLAYVKKYKNLAKKEMNVFGIPASITLAQGLLESNAGESKLATKNKNHFGLKCFSRKCKKGHCSNFTDDSHKDFFKIFNRPADSYDAHSRLLKNGSRYRFLFELKKTDYKGWANGLKKAGYATDPNYDKKLIRLVEELKLYNYD